MTGWLHDLRYGCRLLVREPVFSAVIILTLALGIGANGAVFSALYGIVFLRIGIEDPDRVVVVWSANPASGLDRYVVSTPDFEDWRSQTRSFAHLAATASSTHNLSDGEYAGRMSTLAVSSEYFAVLGSAPVRGRAFAADEFTEGRNRVLLLGHDFWTTTLAADPGVTGRTVKLDGEPYVVIGVMPPGAETAAAGADAWTPLAFSPAGERGQRFLSVIGRLAPGIGTKEAQADLAAVAARVEQSYPDTNRGWGVRVVPLREDIVSNFSLALGFLFGAVTFVLLIACANVANMMLVRGVSRQKEIAVRVSLGAGRWRIVRQLLAESLVLSAIGTALGLVAALWGILALRDLFGAVPIIARSIGLSGTVVGYLLVLLVATTLTFGLIPALQATRLDLAQCLVQGGRRAGPGHGRQRLRKALVAFETALAVVLLGGMGLSVQNFRALQQIEPGFDPEGILTMRVALSPDPYQDGTRASALFHDAASQLAALPGVESAAAISRVPLTGSMRNPSRSIALEGRTGTSGDPSMVMDAIATPDYFRAMGIPMLRGQGLSDRDTAESAPVCVVNRALADRFFPSEDPVGKRVRLGGGDSEEPWRTILGVAGDVINDDRDAPPLPTVYLPLAQNPKTEMALVARTSGDPMAMVSAATDVLRRLDRDQPVFDVKSMRQIMYDDLLGVRQLMGLLGVFAGLALALAGAGVFGLMSYSVSQRAFEFGVRMAVGAATGDIVRLVLFEGLVTVGIGCGIGFLGALGLNQAASSTLYQASLLSPSVFAPVLLLFGAIAFAACLIPAVRAARSVSIVELLR